MEHVVRHAVTLIHERFWEPLTLDDLARSAMVSKYHFLRVFTRVTGITPGRFLTAVRLQEAKRLLLSTPLTVADVSARVGYSSSGSFTRRFTELVGLSPTQYRKLSLTARDELRDPTPLDTPPAAPPARPTGLVTGALRTDRTTLTNAYVGAFDSPLLQGVAASWHTAPAPGRFTLTHIPHGTWYIHAVAQSTDHATAAPHTLLTATIGPVRVKGDTRRLPDITLAPMDWTHPPILSALTGIDPQPLAA
ncbi:helix-turn-helix transcriptional regulator [Streptomyces sp. NPDC057877]|uniref:helix-turn-helix transcriptional regulator n=1 Tax=Streptomyces sp. NPDC057877 TaxID=3346269 RepID=UPI0036CF132C